MSEPSVPKSLKEAISTHIVWGSLVFTCFLSFIEKIVEQHYGAAWIAFLLGSTIVIVTLNYKRWVESINPNWAFVGFSLVIFTFVTMPFIEQRRWPFLAQLQPSSPSVA